MLNQIVREPTDVSHVWLHDSDDFSHGTRLAKQMAFMSRHRLDICSCFEIRLRSESMELVDYPVHVTRALRIEKFYAFWGQDLDSHVTPLECGRAFRTKLDKNIDFIGRKALEEQHKVKTKRDFLVI